MIVVVGEGEPLLNFARRVLHGNEPIAAFGPRILYWNTTSSPAALSAWNASSNTVENSRYAHAAARAGR